MPSRRRIAIVIKDNFAWVYYSFLYWINPSLTNHLKFRWYHYKFCQRRGEVFLVQFYLGQWKEYMEDILTKHPEKIIPSHGLFAILYMMRENKLEELTSFLENQSIESAMATLIEILNTLNDKNPAKIATLSNLNQPFITDPRENFFEEKESILSIGKNTAEISSKFQDIHGRTWVIALQIHYQLFISLSEYYLLTAIRAKYLEVIKATFRVDQVKTKYRDIDYNYVEVLKKGTGSEKGQLLRQLKQIIANPSIFGDRIVEHVKEILNKTFPEKI